MSTRLPFTLNPLDGEPFDLWLHAYAARLATSPGRLAEALGIPGRQDHEPAAARLSAAQIAAVCAATGLAPPAVTAMLAAGPSPPSPLILAWAPQRATRFCPACLAEDPGEMPAAWSLPVTFFCLRHGRLLASRCPHCDRPPASRPLPSRAGHCGGPGGCGTRLDTASPPRHDCTPAARQAQEAVSRFLAGLRDPAGTAGSRRHALAQLSDFSAPCQAARPPNLFLEASRQSGRHNERWRRGPTCGARVSADRRASAAEPRGGRWRAEVAALSAVEGGNGFAYVWLRGLHV